MADIRTEDEMPDEWYDGPDDDDELDEDEEAMYHCHGYFDIPGQAGIFMCGAVGSEDCDECPMNCWLGLNHRQIDRLEERGDE